MLGMGNSLQNIKDPFKPNLTKQYFKILHAVELKTLQSQFYALLKNVNRAFRSFKNPKHADLFNVLLSPISTLLL